MEDITDTDYAQAKRVFKDFEIKNLGEYHDVYVQSNKLLLSDVFENFWNMYLEIYELGPAIFLTAPGLVWQAPLKKTKIELDLLTDIDVINGRKKVLEGKYVTLFIDTQKLITNTWKIIIKIKNRHKFNIGIYIIYMVEQCRKTFQ